MKTKILEALETKYKTLGLSKSALDTVAELLSESIKQESEIESAISSPKCENLLKAFQSNDDKVRTENRKLKEELEALKKQPVKPDEKSNPSDDVSKQLAELKKQQEELSARIAADDKQKKDDGIIKTANELLKSDKYKCTNDTVRNIVMRSYSVGKDDTAETIADRAKREYDSTYKELYGEGVPPIMGGGVTPPKFDGKSEVERLRAEGKIPKETNN